MTDMLVGCVIGAASLLLVQFATRKAPVRRIVVHPQHYNELLPLLNSTEERDRVRLTVMLHKLYPDTQTGKWVVEGNDEILILVQRRK